MQNKAKFWVISAVIVGTLIWLGFQGVSEAATYYVTVSELHAMDAEEAQRRLRVGGDVVEDSIVRFEDRVEFTIDWEGERLNVVYVGREPLPDTFRDGAQALCDGRLRNDQVFEAKKIQAKCASKYEATPGKGAKPVYEQPAGAEELSQASL